MEEIKEGDIVEYKQYIDEGEEIEQYDPPVEVIDIFGAVAVVSWLDRIQGIKHYRVIHINKLKKVK